MGVTDIASFNNVILINLVNLFCLLKYKKLFFFFAKAKTKNSDFSVAIHIMNCEEICKNILY